MVLSRSQSRILTNQFSNISINQQVQMDYPVLNYVLSPFLENINHGYPKGFKLYLQFTKYIYKETEKLHIKF